MRRVKSSMESGPREMDARAAPATASRPSNLQYGALPWRRTGQGIQVLLITTRNTRRWIVPKGWPAEGKTPAECAALEAFEEAGVRGNVAPEVLGSFHHRKQLKSGEMVVCRVQVFALEVTEAHDEWSEKADRELAWCSIEEALARVGDGRLRRLIAKFAQCASAQPATHVLPVSA